MPEATRTDVETALEKFKALDNEAQCVAIAALIALCTLAND